MKFCPEKYYDYEKDEYEQVTAQLTLNIQENQENLFLVFIVKQFNYCRILLAFCIFNVQRNSLDSKGGA